jgi:hypothetical protein
MSTLHRGCGSRRARESLSRAASAFCMGSRGSSCCSGDLMEEHSTWKTHSHHISVSLPVYPRPRPAMTWSNFLDRRFEPSLYTSCGAKSSHMSCASLRLEIATEAHIKMAAQMTQPSMLHLFHAARTQGLDCCKTLPCSPLMVFISTLASSAHALHMRQAASSRE